MPRRNVFESGMTHMIMEVVGPNLATFRAAQIAGRVFDPALNFSTSLAINFYQGDAPVIAIVRARHHTAIGMFGTFVATQHPIKGLVISVGGPVVYDRIVNGMLRSELSPEHWHLVNCPHRWHAPLPNHWQIN